MAGVKVQDGRRGRGNPNIAEAGKATQIKPGEVRGSRYPFAMQLYTDFIQETVKVVKNGKEELIPRFRMFLEKANHIAMNDEEYGQRADQMLRFLMDFSGGAKIIYKQMELELLALQVNKTDRLTQLLEENALTDRHPPKDYTPYEETTDELLKKKTKAKSEKKK